MAGLLREHDKNQFEIFIYSYGNNKKGKSRKELLTNTENFHDVSQFSDAEVERLAKSHKLHIAIDLKGYTSKSRTQLFQYGLAPIQINYLGYPGSLGADFFDYLVADQIVIPECHQNTIRKRLSICPTHINQQMTHGPSHKHPMAASTLRYLKTLLFFAASTIVIRLLL